MYFGDLGSRSKTFIKYLESVPGVSPIPPRSNPASWMLEEIGVGVASMRSERAEAREGKQDGDGGEDIENPVQPVEKKPDSTGLGVAGGESQANLVKRLKDLYFTSATFNKALKRIRQLDAIGKEATGGDAANLVKNALKPEISKSHGSDREDSVSHVSRNDQPENSRMKRQPSYSANSVSHAPLPTHAGSSLDKNPPTTWQQFSHVVSRGFRGHWRNPPFLFARLRTMVFVSVLFGLIYLDLQPNSQTSVISKIAAIQVTVTFTALTHGATATPNMMSIREVFYRERASGMYAPWIYALSSVLVETFWSVVSAVLLQIPVYWMVGLRNDTEGYFTFLLAAFLTCEIFVTMSMLVVAVSANSAQAGIIQGFYFGFFFTFSGIAITKNSIPAGYKWLFEALPIRHITEALVMPQFAVCSPLPNCGPTFMLTEGNIKRPEYIAKYASDYLGFSYDGFGQSIGWACLYLGVAMLLGFICTTKLVHSTR